METAYEKERREGGTFSFPIRLDESVMETDEAWAAKLRQQRHIGDFKGWNRSAKEHDEAFEKLLEALQSG